MTAAASHTASGKQGGFTYVSLMIVVAIIGLVTAAAIKLGSVIQRAKAEQELLRIGAEFSDALQSYADATPAGKPSQPASIKDLLKDPRFTATRRHLRKLYVDPMTGKAEWGIVYVGDKVGVAAIPMSAFCDPAAQRADLWNHLVRFTFCKRDDTIDEAITRLRRL